MPRSRSGPAAVHLADPLLQVVVVGGRGAGEPHPARTERADRADDVVGAQPQVLHPGAVVLGEERVDLTGPPTGVRLQQHQGDPPGGVLHHLGVHRLTGDLDVLLEDLREAEHPLVERDGVVELTGRHADRRWSISASSSRVDPAGRGRLDRAGQELVPVAAPLHQPVQHVTEAAHLGRPPPSASAPVPGSAVEVTGVAPRSTSSAYAPGGVADLPPPPPRYRHRAGTRTSRAGGRRWRPGGQHPSGRRPGPSSRERCPTNPVPGRPARRCGSRRRYPK